jgi:hypothetical protein
MKRMICVLVGRRIVRVFKIPRASPIDLRPSLSPARGAMAAAKDGQPRRESSPSEIQRA